MEIMTIVGKRDVSFTDQKTGSLVEGVSFYFTMEADGVDGLMAGKLYLTLDRIKRLERIPKVGEKVAVSYDRYGKPSEFKPLS